MTNPRERLEPMEGRADILGILAVIAIVLGAILCAGNWYACYESYKSKRFVSSIPFFGAILLGIGCCYFPATRPFAWLSIIVDYGTLTIVLSLPHTVRNEWSTGNMNLVYWFSSTDQGRNVDIKLFKRGIFIAQVVFNPPVVCNEHGALIKSFGLKGSWEAVNKGFTLTGYSGGREAEIKELDVGYSLKEHNYPSDKKHKYDSLHSPALKKGGNGYGSGAAPSGTY